LNTSAVAPARVGGMAIAAGAAMRHRMPGGDEVTPLRRRSVGIDGAGGLASGWSSLTGPGSLRRRCLLDGLAGPPSRRPSSTTVYKPTPSSWPGRTARWCGPPRQAERSARRLSASPMARSSARPWRAGQGREVAAWWVSGPAARRSLGGSDVLTDGGRIDPSAGVEVIAPSRCATPPGRRYPRLDLGGGRAWAPPRTWPPRQPCGLGASVRSGAGVGEREGRCARRRARG
jgi:hypothetical protein